VVTAPLGPVKPPACEVVVVDGPVNPPCPAASTDDLYKFQDASGVVNVDIDHKRWNGVTVGPQDTVVVTAPLGPVKPPACEVVVVDGPVNPPCPAASTGMETKAIIAVIAAIAMTPG
jgi:hypothetical protein